MPAYNFKPQFVAPVESGQKRCTIRGKAPKVGSTAYLYTGMRTKACRKLGEGVVTNVTRFMIYVDNTTYGLDICIFFGGIRLDEDEIVELAIKDGFKSAYDFGRFFLDVYGDKFSGHLIEWELKV
jgi:hypothetical protein